MDSDSNDWLQFVSTSLDNTPSEATEPQKPVAEKTQAQLPSALQLNTALLTPPASSHGSPTDETEEHAIVSVSTTFFPGANISPHRPDLVFLSSDTVFFYVHVDRVVGASRNRFNSLIPEELARAASDPSSPPPTTTDKDDVGPVILLPEHSSVLNVVLHTIYGMSCVMYAPAVSTLAATISALVKYDVPLDKYVAPSTPLFQLLQAQSPISPIEAYACAAEHGLHELCVQISPHLLTVPLSEIRDEDAAKMGPVYLKKMVFLHLGRIDALKRLLLPPPQAHPPMLQCGFHEQKKLTRAWALASAYLAWDARPDLPTVLVESALGPLGDHLTCDICKTALHERIKQLIVQWALVKRTI